MMKLIRFCWLHVAILLMAMILCSWASPAHSRLSDKPREETWATNGLVTAIAVGDGVIYLGGEFTCVNPCTGPGASLDLATGRLAAPYAKVNGVIHACAPDGAGGWYIGGQFTEVGGLARNNLAHILANGVVDTSWNPNANAAVYALTLAGSTVYAGGHFANIGGQVRNNIAALDATTGAATNWNPSANGDVCTLAVSGSTIYVGGRFTNIGGQPRNRIAALGAATGAATDWNPNASGDGYASVNALAISGATVYVGGNFTDIGGQARNCIAALDSTTGSATDWDPNASGANVSSTKVSALAVLGTTIYAGGQFTSIGGQARNSLVALDTATGLVKDWNPNVTNGSSSASVNALAVSGSKVFVGGMFKSIGGLTRNALAELDATTGVATDWNSNAIDNKYGLPCVNALAVSNSSVYAGGDFSSIGGLTRNHLAALDARTGAPTDWNPNVDGIDQWTCVEALAVSGSTVYAGGHFTSIGGQERINIAAVNATTGAATDWNPNADGNTADRFYALAVSGSKVYAGGDFYRVGGKAVSYLAALDAATGSVMDWYPHSGKVYTLAISGSTLYAGGRIYFFDEYINGLVARNATTGDYIWDWNPHTSGPDNSDVSALAISGSTIYAGGSFTNIGGQPRKGLAAVDASTALATNWNTNTNGGVFSLAVSGSTVYAGGYFTDIGGKTRNNIAALDTATGSATDWNPNAEGFDFTFISAMAVSGPTVYVGGRFTTIGGQTRPYFAQFDMGADAENWRLYE